MNKLPKWFLTKGLPAYTDHESATAIEQTYKLYQSMNTLIEEYNTFVDSTNSTIEEFINKYNGDIEVFATSLRQEFQDFIDVIDLKIADLESSFNEELNQKSNEVESNVDTKLLTKVDKSSYENDMNEVENRLKEVEKEKGKKFTYYRMFDRQVVEDLKNEGTSGYPHINTEDDYYRELFIDDYDVVILDFTDFEGYNDDEDGHCIQVTCLEENSVLYLIGYDPSTCPGIEISTARNFHYNNVFYEDGAGLINGFSMIPWNSDNPNTLYIPNFNITNETGDYNYKITFEWFGKSGESYEDDGFLLVRTFSFINGEI